MSVRDAQDERSCHRCSERKPGEAFPYGRSGRRRSSICWTCWETEAWAYLARIEEWRATWVDPETGRKIRRCPDCRDVKDLLDDFYLRNKRSGERMPYCKSCTNARNLTLYYEQMSDPARAPRLKTRRAANSRRYYNRNVERDKARKKAWLRRVKDEEPERYAKMLEDARIDHRLQAEREGRKVRGGRARVRQREAPSYLPSAPLAALVGQIVDRRTAVSEVLGDRERKTRNGVVGEVCDELGVTERTYRRWKKGDQPKVRIGLAEKVLLNAGVEWHEIYSYDDHAAQFLAEVPA